MSPDRPAPAPAPSQEHPWGEEKVRGFREALLEFFQEVRRELPWRETADPYRILVSEVMLQQTRVETVVPYYQRWMERFPDPGSLAAADADEVLGLWEGLGYYSRARNLHRAVREVVARYQGEVPSEPEELRTLPGVGPYTAGAVASIAFSRPVPAVDGNVRRVLSRLMDAPAPTPRELEEWAGALVDPDRPGDFNQALMELGALVCAPRSPDCGGCPVAAWCAARAAGTQAERPAAGPRKTPPLVDEAVAVLACPGPAGQATRVLLRKRPEEGLLGGLWEFPGVKPASAESPREAAGRLARELLGRIQEAGAVVAASPTGGGMGSGGGPGPTRDRIAPKPAGLPVVPHAFSHRRMRYHPFLFRLSHGRDPEAELRPPLRWVGLDATEDFPLPVAQRAVLANVVQALTS